MGIYQLTDRTIDPARYPWGYNPTSFDHGPGPTEMDYDPVTDTGYYGLVTSEDFISGDALAEAIGLSAGTSQQSTTPWMKFYIGPDAACNAFVRRGHAAQAYVAFIPQKPIRNNAPWDDIYDAGAVFGTGDNGPYNSGENVTQDAQVTVGTGIFRVRLATCANANPFGDDRACEDNIGEGSEWNDLIYRVHTDSPNCDDPNEGVSDSETTRHGGPQDGDNWANFTDNDMITHQDFGDGSYCWGQETSSSSTGRRVARGFRGVGYFNDFSSSFNSTDLGWRPVLEMIQ